MRGQDKAGRSGVVYAKLCAPHKRELPDGGRIEKERSKDFQGCQMLIMHCESSIPETELRD